MKKIVYASAVSLTSVITIIVMLFGRSDIFTNAMWVGALAVLATCVWNTWQWHLRFQNSQKSLGKAVWLYRGLQLRRYTLMTYIVIGVIAASLFHHYWWLLFLAGATLLTEFGAIFATMYALAFTLLTLVPYVKTRERMGRVLPDAQIMLARFERAYVRDIK